MAVKKDYQKDSFKNDFSENEKIAEKNEVKESKIEEIKKYAAEPLKKMKYPVEAKEDIFCDKDKITSVSIDKPKDVKESVFIISASPLFESVGIDHKEIIDFDNGNIVKLRMTSVASSLSFKIAKGSKLFDLIPVA